MSRANLIPNLENSLGNSSTAVVIDATEEVETSLDPTQTKPLGLKPKRQKTVPQTQHSRIIMVSPYGQLNAYFESMIPKIVDGGFTDIISEAETNKPPYIDIMQKEVKAQRPFWIIDFQRIMAVQPSPQYLLGLGLKALREYFSHYLSEQGSSEVFAESLRKPTLSEKIDSILDELGSDLRIRLMADFETSLKDAHERALIENPVIGVVHFSQYQQFAEVRKITYITPSPQFSGELVRMHSCDEAGNFLPNAVSITDYISRLNTDLEILTKRFHTQETLLLQRKF